MEPGLVVGRGASIAAALVTDIGVSLTGSGPKVRRRSLLRCRASGKPVPDAVWQVLAAQKSDEGMLYATPSPRIGTDLPLARRPPTRIFSTTTCRILRDRLGRAGSQSWNPFTGHP